MKREDLKEIISSVIEKMKQDAPEAACGMFWSDNSVNNPGPIGGDPGDDPPNINPFGGEEPRMLTTHYAVGEED